MYMFVKSIVGYSISKTAINSLVEMCLLSKFFLNKYTKYRFYALDL